MVMAARRAIVPGSVASCYSQDLTLDSRLVVVLGTPVDGRVEVTEVHLPISPHTYSACYSQSYQIRCLLVVHVATDVVRTVLTYVSAFTATP